jgi:flagellar hook-basal body complex protein FliE
MNVDRMQQLVQQMRALAAEAAASPRLDGAQAPAGAARADGDFAKTLQAALEGVNAQMQRADHLQAEFSTGTSNLSLSDVMLATQKASLSFQAALQVRNKLVTAYQDIMNIQA